MVAPAVHLWGHSDTFALRKCWDFDIGKLFPSKAVALIARIYYMDALSKCEYDSDGDQAVPPTHALSYVAHDSPPLTPHPSPTYTHSSSIYDLVQYVGEKSSTKLI